MKIEDLKPLLNEQKVAYSKEEISDIFTIKVKHRVNLVNRSMYLDFVLMMSAAVIMVAITFFLGLKSRYIISLEILTTTMILFIHYRIKYRLLNQPYLKSENVLLAIKKVNRRLSAYLKAYHWLTPLFLGAIFVKTCWNIMLARGENFIDWAPQFLLVIPVVAIIYFVVKWISRRMYGKQLKSLQEVERQLTHYT